LFAVVSLSCVSKEKYVELETHLNQTRQQSMEKDEQLTEMASRLQASEMNVDRCMQDLSALQNLFKDMEAANSELFRKKEDLERELEKKESIIRLQEDVIDQTDKTRKNIETKLKKQIEKQEIKIEEMKGKLKVTFIDKILFDTGSVQIQKRGKALLLEIAELLQENRHQDILVQGHTDNVKIGSALASRFPTNWELSTRRATAVVRFLQEQCGLAPERLSACGHSYYQPLASNETEEGRHENRRIEIILVPAD
jgi:chemotaxis protein MotB